MQMQNQFKTGLDIAKYTAAIMRRDMAEYDADSSKYTQSLGCWHGFIAQQKNDCEQKIRLHLLRLDGRTSFRIQFHQYTKKT